MIDERREPRPLWTCPDCGRQFVTPRTYHSCGDFEIAAHFAGKTPATRALFDQLVAAVKEFGPVTVYAQKSRIVFQARTRFAAVMVRRRWLVGHIWLKRPAQHPLIYRLERYTYRDYGHVFRLTRPEELDAPFLALLHEAYVMGSQ